MDRKEGKDVRLDEVEFGLKPSAALVCYRPASAVEDNVFSG